MSADANYDEVDRLIRLLHSQIPKDASPSLAIAALLRLAHVRLIETLKTSPLEPSARVQDTLMAIGWLSDDLTQRAK